MATNVEGFLTRKEQLKLYLEKTGQTLDSFDFYYCFGLFRLAAILQQIYYRYYHGQTKDKRFEILVYGVQAIEKVEVELIDKSRM
jgi:aminoglycoside phosphotransferase (APT) family kinase protein